MASKPVELFDPEPIEDQVERFHKAVDHEHDVEAMRLGTVTQPGEQKCHIFDREDGLRLVISVDVQPQDGHRLLHIGASVFDNTQLYHRIARKKIKPNEFYQEIGNYLESLMVNETLELKDVMNMGMTSDGVIHLGCQVGKVRHDEQPDD